MSPVISRQISYPHRYVVSLNVINIWHSKAVSTPLPIAILPIHALTPPPPPLPRQSCQSFLHVFVLLYYLQSDIITISCGRGVCGCSGALGRGGGGDGDGGGGGGATAVVSTTSDLTHFRHRNLNFLKYGIFAIA